MQKFGTKKSHSNYTFSEVPNLEIPRSKFNRNHCVKTAFDSGYLIPVMWDEVLPGDTFNVKMTSFARLSTPIVPFLDNLYLDTFHFFVPYRLLWSDFKKFMGEIDASDVLNPAAPIYATPQVISGGGIGFPIESLFDYLGAKTETAGALACSAFPSRAYNLIYNEWFRDENIIDPITVNLNSTTPGTEDVAANYVLRRRGKRHDYFTSCLPWPQKGAAVAAALGGSAPVSLDVTQAGQIWGVYDAADYTTISSSGVLVSEAVTGNLMGGAASALDVVIDPRGGLAADLTGISGLTINALREAIAMQQLLEIDARGGTRYTEVIKAHFGVNSPDARQQRPEYLGGNSTRIQINPIAQTGGTSASGTTTPLGNLAAMGTHYQDDSGYFKSFTEHGVVMTIVNVRAELTYQQGMERPWNRVDKYDYYWPALAHIGEQEVLQIEIFCDGTGADSTVFGYQERYAEYRYKPSKITGKMRSDYATPLDTWHLAQEFTGAPTLDAAFIEENPPVARVVAVPSEPELLFDAYFEMDCARPMPLYGTPGLRRL